jgi:hypothetical protein
MGVTRGEELGLEADRAGSGARVWDIVNLEPKIILVDSTI